MSTVLPVPAVVEDDAADMERGRLAAERARLAGSLDDDERELLLLQAAERARRDLVLLHASAEELRQAIWAGHLTEEHRIDLAADVLACAARVQSFALTVLG